MEELSEEALRLPLEKVFRKWVYGIIPHSRGFGLSTLSNQGTKIYRVREEHSPRTMQSIVGTRSISHIDASRSPEKRKAALRLPQDEPRGIEQSSTCLT